LTIQRILRNVLHIQNFNVYLLFYLDTEITRHTTEFWQVARYDSLSKIIL